MTPRDDEQTVITKEQPSPRVIRITECIGHAQTLENRLRQEGSLPLCMRLMKGFVGCGEEDLPELMRFLFQATHKELALDFALLFFLRNPASFSYVTDDFRNHAKALLNKYAESYPDELSIDESILYQCLNGREQITFRICHQLALRETQDYPSPLFHLSCNDLRLQAGLSSNKDADRILKRLQGIGVIHKTKNGDQRKKGMAKPKGSEWIWVANLSI